MHKLVAYLYCNINLCIAILAKLALVANALSPILQGIPVMGAIMLNPAMDKCLLVRGWGSHASWGFPRGKVNEAEPDASCAIREVQRSSQTPVIQLDVNNLFSELGKYAHCGGIFAYFSRCLTQNNYI